MIPTSPRELKRLLKKYGIDVRELPEVRSVTLSADAYDILVRDPQVAILDLGQQKVIQIVCSSMEKVERKQLPQQAPAVSEEDVQFVVEQTGASREEVLRTLAEEGGDIARAIMKLQERRRSSYSQDRVHKPSDDGSAEESER
ncbi:MAG: nascent polypeptide-associated complex protein [Sulfolobales archaeon]|nr:nascent polypeptide-associated complex protein [Sulfolobales archaeon]MCX8209298.1 nascent polypeptide-associated complex protein [Sulfolobales archaeon]MDW8010441.1 nascent polypeptide-associated complex protein [Sulfolobales archaeon]